MIGNVCHGCGGELVETSKPLCQKCIKEFERVASICHTLAEKEGVLH
jgi:predicted amidophosphoribosyltransferase